MKSHLCNLNQTGDGVLPVQHHVDMKSIIAIDAITGGWSRRRISAHRIGWAGRMRRQRSRWIGLAAASILTATNAMAQAPVQVAPAKSAAVTDTSGTGGMQWSFDRGSVPWVQRSGSTEVLSPGSSATLMTLECESADLERDRLGRHLSADECEHRMAAIRVGQDTSLLFRLDLRVIDFQGALGLTRLGPGASIWLEDDRGRRW